MPAEVDDCRRRIQALETEQEILQREATVGMEHTPRLTEIKDNLAKQRAELAELEKHWDEEKKVVAKILELRARLRAARGFTIEAKPNEMKPKLAANPGKRPYNRTARCLIGRIEKDTSRTRFFSGRIALDLPKC